MLRGRWVRGDFAAAADGEGWLLMIEKERMLCTTSTHALEDPCLFTSLCRRSNGFGYSADAPEEQVYRDTGTTAGIVETKRFILSLCPRPGPLG